ncbi:MAG: Fe-S cluster assembly ATPase SufC [bacterium]
MLDIKNLHVSVEGKKILKGIDLKVNAGEVHAIMGPNGSGKSTLAQVLAGNEAFEVTEGEVWFDGKNLLEMEPDVRACEGLFMAFQYPVEIPGVTNTYFLKAALNSKRKYHGLPELDAIDFLEIVREKVKLVELDDSLLKRSVNEGFSGGEKKRNEIFQMAVLDPKLAILDETDSGLDVDALRIVAGGVNQLRNPKRAIVVITHYQRILNYLEPDFVHILAQGKIVKSGGSRLAHEVEAKGYDWLKDEIPSEETVGV